MVFIEKNKIGITIGRVYLITTKQFYCIQEKEEKRENWYDSVIEMGVIKTIFRI